MRPSSPGQPRGPQPGPCPPGRKAALCTSPRRTQHQPNPGWRRQPWRQETSVHQHEPSCEAEDTMKHVAAYLLAQLGGNSSPDAKAVSAILDSVGAECDEAKCTKLLSALSGKDLVEVLAAGRAKMAAMPSGGGGGGGGAAPAAAAKGGGGAAAAPAAKEEAPEEEEEDMGFDLFD